MDREVRQHLLRPQLGSRKRKAEFAFPENRTKMGRLDMVANYVNPMSGLVHRHAPYKLQMPLGTTHPALGRMKDALLLNHVLQQRQHTRDNNHRPLTQILTLTRLPPPLGVHKPPKLCLTDLDHSVNKDAKITLPQTLDTKRQKLLRDRTDNTQLILTKRLRPQSLDTLALSSMSYPLSPSNYLDIGIRPYLMYSPATTPPRGVHHPLRIAPGALAPYMSYVHPISLALDNSGARHP